VGPSGSTVALSATTTRRAQQAARMAANEGNAAERQALNQLRPSRTATDAANKPVVDPHAAHTVPASPPVPKQY